LHCLLSIFVIDVAELDYVVFVDIIIVTALDDKRAHALAWFATNSGLDHMSVVTNQTDRNGHL